MSEWYDFVADASATNVFSMSLACPSSSSIMTMVTACAMLAIRSPLASLLLCTWTHECGKLFGGHSRTDTQPFLRNGYDNPPRNRCSALGASGSLSSPKMDVVFISQSSRTVEATCAKRKLQSSDRWLEIVMACAKTIGGGLFVIGRF